MEDFNPSVFTPTYLVSPSFYCLYIESVCILDLLVISLTESGRYPTWAGLRDVVQQDVCLYLSFAN